VGLVVFLGPCLPSPSTFSPTTQPYLHHCHLVCGLWRDRPPEMHVKCGVSALLDHSTGPGASYAPHEDLKHPLLIIISRPTVSVILSFLLFCFCL